MPASGQYKEKLSRVPLCTCHGQETISWLIYHDVRVPPIREAGVLMVQVSSVRRGYVLLPLRLEREGGGFTLQT